MQEWRVYSKKADFEAIGRQYGIDPVVARIIRNRDVIGDAAVDMYMKGTLADLHSLHNMKDMDRAIEIISNAIHDSKPIRIIGDYDIDGICSIYILFKGLIGLGADVDYEVPNRISDGYGINENLIKQAYDDGRRVIITCDNGIAAISQISYAKSLGMTVVVTDHHDVQFEDTDVGRKYLIPEADAVVDPKQPDCEYPFKSLCGAGIAYKFICGMYEYAGKDINLTEEFIEIAAIATVGDVVDLQDENRIIVKEGLRRIRNTSNYGLNALIMLTGVNKEMISAYHIGFVIGPCLNASGRLDTAKRAVKMLLSQDRETAERYAGELKDLNDARKKITIEAAAEAIQLIENSTIKDDKVLVVYLPDCHESVAGIVAGKIREKYYKPAIVLTDSEEGIKGSARSIESYNIFEKLMECNDILTKFGGHPMAAGLSLEKGRLEELRIRLNSAHGMSDSDLVEKIWIDVPMPIEYINEKVIKDLELLAPFGKANEKPVFADRNLIIRSITEIGRHEKYTKMKLAKANGTTIEAVGFFPPDELKRAYVDNKRISCTYYPEINEFMGNRKLQICITGYKISE